MPINRRDFISITNAIPFLFLKYNFSFFFRRDIYEVHSNNSRTFYSNTLQVGAALIMCKKEGTNRKMNGLCILAYL
jgi:hypothetical protein